MNRVRDFLCGLNLGVVMAMGLIGCYMDYLGKDKYIEHLHETWVNIPFWLWPIWILAAIVMVFLYAQITRRRHGS